MSDGKSDTVDPLAETQGPTAIDPLAQTEGPAAIDPLAQTEGPAAIDPLAQTEGPAAIDPLAQTAAPLRSDRLGRASLTELGRYRPIRRLGQGGMGVVYEAEDPELGRKVAVKLVRAGLVDPDLRRRLAREAQAMARVSHPNVVTVHDVGMVGDQLFIAMELVDGGNLRQWLGVPRSRRDIVSAFVSAGHGLAAAHAAGIIHRDFKPDNVLVGDGRFRVTDFGLAGERQVSEELVTPNPEADRGDGLTVAGDVMGTPAYMAPEQHAGEHVGARADQFSFAVSLYEALYGQRPFAEGSYQELVDAVKAGRVEPPPPKSRVPKSLRRILLKALSTRPSERYPTMRALLDALSRDRTRVPRAVARLSLAVLVSVVVALGADWIARGRALAVSHSSFAAARDQLSQLLRFRGETFTALSDLVKVLPVIRQVTAANDQADFGLGDAVDDEANLAAVHEQLASASWDWLSTLRDNVLVVADYKGRLVYTSADEAAWGQDVTDHAALDRAFRAGGQVITALVRTGDPAVVRSGIFGDRSGTELYVMFARAMVPSDLPEALFALAIPGEQLLDDVSLGEGTRLSLLSADGESDGNVPAPVIEASGRSQGITEVSVDGNDWLVDRRPLGGSSGSIGHVVLARRLDVGLAGLFAGARTILSVLAGLLLATAIGAWILARRS